MELKKLPKAYYKYANIELNEKDKDLVDNARVTDEEIDVNLIARKIKGGYALKTREN